jgi:hypothetical protein
MILDAQTRLSNAQALTATADSTNYIDLGSDRDIGRGNPQALVITVDTAADTADANETYQFQVETDDNTSFSSSTIIADRTIAGASLTAGSRHVIPLGLTNERYLQGVYTLGGTSPSVTVTAFIQPMDQIAAEDVVYANGYTIA